MQPSASQLVRKRLHRARPDVWQFISISVVRPLEIVAAISDAKECSQRCAVDPTGNRYFRGCLKSPYSVIFHRTMFPHSSFQTAGANPSPRTVSLDLRGMVVTFQTLRRHCSDRCTPTRCGSGRRLCAKYPSFNPTGEYEQNLSKCFRKLD
jgi:hypothetical protein